MEKKIDKILETVIRMEVSVDRNTADVAEHIRRTNLLEKRIDKTESWIDKWKGALKLVTIITLICTAIGGLTALVLRIGG